MADEVKAAETAAVAQRQPLPELPAWMGLEDLGSFSTIDTRTEEGFRLASKTVIGCDQDLSEIVGKQISLKSWLMVPYHKLDERTGEELQLVHIALITSDNKTYSCSSLGVRKSILLLSRQFGFHEWKPAVTVEVRQIKAKMGSMLALEYIGREDGRKRKGE